ncbi:hypothetical protein [uncultured Rubinisphaera sp.]|uniref:hypothetical protein n=1 Tax=uncultured Rubinisphaera sp. TaxID=1678686 RepID=UPI000EED686E|nr:hypothetical protein [Planctomycetaceae bacterium]
MRALLTIAVLSTATLLSQSVDAANTFRGGFTIASHSSGRSYYKSSVRYMTGRGPRSQSYLVGAGHVDKSGNAVIDTYTRGRVSYLGQWAGGPRGYVVTDSRRRNENFVFVYANGSRYAIVDNIDLR